MICPKCGYAQNAKTAECENCGVIFSKIKKAHKPITLKKQKNNKIQKVLDYILTVKEKPTASVFTGELILTTVIAYITLRFAFASLSGSYILNSFLHYIILPFHEAGHVFFRPFGRLVTSMGGSLGQLIIPAVCFLVFLLQKKDNFASAVTFWWLGTSFVDLSPYIYDAKAMVMPLVGGVTGRTAPYGYHDWNYILTETGLLPLYKSIAYLFYITGLLIMVVSFIWIVFLIKKQKTLIAK
jgi:hypothetical protein